MGGSIVVDFWRSRMLANAARTYHSSALEADALNFRADMFSSSVVILGLAITAYAEHTGRAGGLLVKADAVAALVVGVVIIRMSGSFALQAIQVMLDRAPTGLRDRMTRAVAAVPGVVSVEPVRVRESGNRIFADVVVTTPRTASLAEAHAITERIEAALRTVEERAEAVVHIEPASTASETAVEAMRAVALGMGMATHHEQVYAVERGVACTLEASLHLEVPPELTLAQAHVEAHRLTDAIRADNPRLARVDVHIEVAEPHPLLRRDITAEHPETIVVIETLLRETEPTVHCTETRLYQADADEAVEGARKIGADRQPRRESSDVWDLVLVCSYPAKLTVGDVHRRTEALEQRLRETLLPLGRVIIHAEPSERGT